MTIGSQIAWDDTVLPFQLDRSDIRGRVARLDGVLDQDHHAPGGVDLLRIEHPVLRRHRRHQVPPLARPPERLQTELLRRRLLHPPQVLQQRIRGARLDMRQHPIPGLDQHEVVLESFYLARTPVTNAQ